METIVKASSSVAKIWGNPAGKPGERYRPMRYLLRVDHEDGTLLHNCVTGEMVLLNEEEKALFESLPAAYSAAMDEAIGKHFLVPEGFDECRSVDQLRKIYRVQRSGPYISTFTILPTSYCNARCFYCYESDYPHVHMTEETANKLVEFIDKRRNPEKNVYLRWFGGEPLVGAARIDQICQGLTERGIVFDCAMTSNGYLFDEELVKKAKDLWKLEHVQITLDGTEETYNKVKAYPGVTGSPYQRVLRNIGLLADAGIHVNIRMNLGFHNQEEIRELIEELAAKFSENKFIAVYVAKLFNNEGFEKVHQTPEEEEALLALVDRYMQRIRELKLAVPYRRLPGLEVNQCIADNNRAILIQPDGGFCRCEHENIGQSYGNLDEGVKDAQRLSYWQEKAEREADCAACVLYPYCYAIKHCGSVEFRCIEKLRNKKVQDSQNNMIYFYEKKKGGKKDERIQETDGGNDQLC